MKLHIFEPSEEYRNFDGRVFVGKMATLVLHKPNESGRQQVSLKSIGGTPWSKRDHYKHPLSSVYDWVERPIGKGDTTIRRKVLGIHLIEAANGGRSSSRTVPSYREYFNEEQKKRVLDHWRAGVIGRLTRNHGGDLDRADIIITFKDFKLETRCWEMKAPQEWKSELYAGDLEPRLERGFYKDADEAIHFFGDKPNDDLFGERYFPVLAIELDHKNTSDLMNAAWRAKSHSDPIVTSKHLLIGTRCKPHEYAKVITNAYEIGGKVVRGMQWDWE
jgi:hypothetical protein